MKGRVRASQGHPLAPSSLTTKAAMSAEQARALAALVTAARDNFVDTGERDLEAFYDASLVVLAARPAPAAVRERLQGPAGALLLALAGTWAAEVNALLSEAHRRIGLPAPALFTQADALALMQPGVLALLNAALLTARTAPQDPERAWARQYERGGAFTALRGAMRGATAGTMNTLANASVIDAAREGGGWILGAYNPLDERTEPLDFRLVTNRGEAVTTARGRVVRSLPGVTGKYTLDNAWVPGPPRIGGDTHDGCRCWLVPERLTL